MPELAKRPVRWRLRLLGALAVALLLVDLNRPPESQASARLLLGAIGVYQATISKVMPSLGVTCRFEPSCSHYGAASIRRYGAAKGSWRAITRIARCGPWTPQGTVDPP